MRNKSYFNELHNNVNRLEKDYENFETLINAHDKLFERFFDFDKAVHSCEGEDMEIFTCLKKVILYEFDRMSDLCKRLEFTYNCTIITVEEETYFRKVKDVSAKISTTKELSELIINELLEKAMTIR